MTGQNLVPHRVRDTRRARSRGGRQGGTRRSCARVARNCLVPDLIGNGRGREAGHGANGPCDASHGPCDRSYGTRDRTDRARDAPDAPREVAGDVRREGGRDARCRVRSRDEHPARRARCRARQIVGLDLDRARVGLHRHHIGAHARARRSPEAGIGIARLRRGGRRRPDAGKNGHASGTGHGLRFDGLHIDQQLDRRSAE